MKFQLTFLFYALGLAVMALVFHQLRQHLAQSGMECVPPAGWDQASRWRDWLALFIELFAFCVMIFLGLVISNRMAGPLYRLKRHMDDVAAGKPVSEIRFRDQDFFMELAQSYNAALKKLGAIPEGKK